MISDCFLVSRIAAQLALKSTSFKMDLLLAVALSMPHTLVYNLLLTFSILSLNLCILGISQYPYYLHLVETGLSTHCECTSVFLKWDSYVTQSMNWVSIEVLTGKLTNLRFASDCNKQKLRSYCSEMQNGLWSSSHRVNNLFCVILLN